jgi:hypothetical protein
MKERSSDRFFLNFSERKQGKNNIIKTIMKKARNNKLLKLISAVSMTFCMLGDGIFTVAASAQTTGDYTGEQWYF